MVIKIIFVCQQIQTLKEKMDSTKIRLQKEAEEQEERHAQQIEDLRQARMRSESQLEKSEAEAKEMNISLWQKMNSLRSNQEDLLRQIASMNSRPSSGDSGGDCILQ